MTIGKTIKLPVLMATIGLLAACSQADGEEAASGAPLAEATEEGDIHATADMHLTATTALQEAMKDTLDQGQIDMLTNVAHQKVVAGHCDGFTIDDDRMRAELNRIHHDAEGNQLDITEDELHLLEKKALLGLGMAVGSQLMIAEMDPDGFCEAAVAEREDETDGSHLIYATSSPEAG